MLFSYFPKTPNKQQQQHGLMQYKETRVEITFDPGPCALAHMAVHGET
jgi:hypothetical protein